MLIPSARAAKHPVYRTRAVFWGEVHDGAKLRYGIGPFRKRADALHAATMWANQQSLGIGDSAKPLRETLADPLPPQKPCNIGLFSDNAKQGDLF